MAHSVDVLHLIKCGEDMAEKNYERQSSLWRSFYFRCAFFLYSNGTIPCFFGIILQIGLKWNSLLFGQLARLSARYMPADILLGSCAAVEHIP